MAKMTMTTIDDEDDNDQQDNKHDYDGGGPLWGGGCTYLIATDW